METFSALLAICAGNSPVPVNTPHKGQWRGALMFILICTRINGWVKNREAGDLRRHRAHYDVIVMKLRRMNAFSWPTFTKPAALSHQISKTRQTLYWRCSSCYFSGRSYLSSSFFQMITSDYKEKYLSEGTITPIIGRRYHAKPGEKSWYRYE